METPPSWAAPLIAAVARNTAATDRLAAKADAMRGIVRDVESQVGAVEAAAARAGWRSA